jgi:hypothetical protein
VKSIVSATDAAALQASHDRVYAALGQLKDAGVTDGVFRSDVSPEDLASTLSGISLANSPPGTQERANRQISLLVDGLRYGAAGGGSR